MTIAKTKQQENCNDAVVEEDFGQNKYDGIITLLVSIGLIASWSATIMLAMIIGANVDDVSFEPQSKPVLYYFFHGGSIVAIIGAGVIAAITGQYERLSKSARIAFWVLQATGITWAIIAYDLKDYLSWKAFGATGPIVWLSCILIFAGMNRAIWKKLDRLINLISYMTAVLALYAMAKYRVIEIRSESGPVMYVVILAWFAGWSLLTSGKAYGWRLWLRTFPFVAFTVTAIFTQTRSWVLMAILLLVTLLVVNAPSRLEDENKRFVRSKVLIALAFIVLVTGLLFQNELVRSFGMLQERLHEDTRTGQYTEFFSQVPVSDLILGRGPTGTWFFGDTDYQFFDNAFLWIAFIGGLPILISYIVLIIVPGVRVFFGGAKGNDAAASVLLILWGIACLGVSTYSHPSLTPYSYFLCLLGRTLSRLSG